MSLFEEAARLEEANRAFAMVTITSSRGSAPRNRGRMIVLPDGSIRGTIGGGPAEKLVIEAAQECLRTGESRSVAYKLDNGGSEGSIQMICGGNMEFFVEAFLPRPSLFLMGGGHVNQAVARMADLLGYPYAVADTRPNMVSAERFPRAAARLVGDETPALLQEGCDEGWIGPETALLIATYNHDESALRRALETPAGYIGMLGSKRKVALLFKRMEEAGFTPEELNRVYAPVGLDLGTETPEEIALSILAEIMRDRSGSSGRSLARWKRPGAAPLVVVRGAGDLATGTISKLSRCGFRVAALEREAPTVIRRTVSFAQALFDGSATVEGITAVKARGEEEIRCAWDRGEIPVIPDPEGVWIERLQPQAVVDAILAKKNLGTRRDMAPTVIGLGPGFSAGEDVHGVIETNRGHNLGRVILEGPAEADTGIPGNIAGFTRERVLRSPASGVLEVLRDIGSLVEEGEPLATVGGQEVLSPLKGVVRGMIAPGTEVPEGFKIADVDPRGDAAYCRIISDKARAIAGGVLEALLRLRPELLTGQAR